jgi:hypothetical protein
MRKTLTFSFALALAFAVAVAAQSQQGEKSMRSDKSKNVTVTGCLQSGMSPESYTLTNITWDKGGMSGEHKGTAGHEGMSGDKKMTLELMPAATTDLKPHVGHKVQVTGMLMDEKSAGQGRQEETRGTAGEEMKHKLKVSTFKHISETCSQ